MAAYIKQRRGFFIRNILKRKKAIIETEDLCPRHKTISNNTKVNDLKLYRLMDRKK